jgi:hypothetical protein
MSTANFGSISLSPVVEKTATGFYGTAYVVKLDRLGNVAWAHQFDSEMKDAGCDISVAADGTVYATGTFEWTTLRTDISSDSYVVSTRQPGLFVIGLTPAGAIENARVVDGAFVDLNSIALAVDRTGRLYATGGFIDTADFDPTANTFNLTAASYLSSGYFAAYNDDSYGTVSGRVWQDSNSNGIQDSTESSVAGAVVELYSSADATVNNGDDVSLGTVTTDATGRYQFTGIRKNSATQAHNYYVVVRGPNAATFTTMDAGSNDAVDSDVNATGALAGATAMFTLSAAQPAVVKDAGLTTTTSVFGSAWSFGAAGSDSSKAMVQDAAGNTYVTGWCENMVDYDSGVGVYQRGAASTGHDLFVAKYDSVGALVWARRIGGSATDEGRAIALGPDGSVYVGGSFQGAAVDFDPGAGVASLTSNGLSDAFLLKLDANGNYVWAKSFGSTGDDAAYGLAVAANGTLYATGVVANSVDFDPGPASATPAINGGSDAYLVQFDANGQYLNSLRFGGAGDDEGRALAVDSTGALYVTGKFSINPNNLGSDIGVNFNPGSTSTSANTVFTAGSADLFVAKYDANLGFGWVSRFGGAGQDYGAAIALASGSQVVVGGAFTGSATATTGGATTGSLITANGDTDAVALKFNAANGSFVWVAGQGGAMADALTALTVGADGSIYTAGTFSGLADLAPGDELFTPVSAGGTDGFVSKLSSSGSLVWAKQIGGAGADDVQAIALAGNSIVTTGSFSGTIDLDPTATVYSLTSLGGTDVYLWKFTATDSAAPGVPDLLAATDSGVSSSDNITKYFQSMDFQITGTIPGANVWIYANGYLVGSAVATGTTTAIHVGVALSPDGPFQFTSRQTEPGKCPSIASGVLNVTVDTYPPAAPLAALDLQAASDSGASNTDNITNDSTPTFDVPASASPYFRVYRGGTLVSGLYETGSTYTAPTQSDGTAAYTIKAVDAAGNESAASTGLNVTVDTAGSRVSRVLAEGSAWSSSFKNYIDSHSLSYTANGATGLGYAIPSGTNQLKALPWSNLNTISIAFNEDVKATLSDFAITGVNKANYTISSLAYNATTHVATLTLPTAIGNDKLLITVNGVTDAAGNALDGEWTNASSAQLYPSGNGTPGGAFSFRFNVLPGDVNSSGRVDSTTDLEMVLNLRGNRVGSANYSIFADLDGDGRIQSTTDLEISLNTRGTRLPAGTPATPLITTSSLTPISTQIRDAAIAAYVSDLATQPADSTNSDEDSLFG